ncbi:MAG: hypothetical protein RLZZ28_140 [Bacteroidota bacterium]
MKHIVLFGAGKSATVLIDYLKDTATKKQWLVSIADINLSAIQAKLGNHSLVTAVELSIDDKEKRAALIASADVVISLMPPSLHLIVAMDCLLLGKHLLTASYVDDKLRLLAEEIKSKDLLFLSEMGLDPGIDHMSAMQLIHRIKKLGGKIISFKSHCGGLVAPESDNNPWHYKFSWNPRNVINAGKAGAIFKEKGTIQNTPYEELYANCAEVFVEGLGQLAYYPNRDSLSYISLYGLEETGTFIRTTLRYPAFCSGWKTMIDLGLTDEATAVNTEGLSTAAFWKHAFAEKNIHLGTELLKQQFDYLGLHEETLINKGVCSKADILQWILEKKWALNENDKDMIVMLHQIDYVVEGKCATVNSSLVVKGEDVLRTAMAKTVGLPLGIAATLLLEGKIISRGLRIPDFEELYQPVLQELESYGIAFRDS